MAVAEAKRAADFAVAIIGGGIGGLVAALSLAHHCPGISVEVFEQAVHYGEIGAGVGINVSAARVLHKLGVLEQANAISGDRGGIHRRLVRWDNGDEVVTIPADGDDKEIHQLSVHRAEFLEILLQAVQERKIAKLHTGKRAIGIDKCNGKRATVKFEDGTSVTADFVVGADGIHSRMRRQFASDLPVYSGRIAYRGLIPIEAISEGWPHPTFCISWLGPKKHFLIFPISGNKILNVVAFAAKPEEELGDLQESWSSHCPRAELEAEYDGWDPCVHKIIQNMPSTVGKWKINDREPLDVWTHLGGRLALLGDAVHAMLPHQGSGAGHAIEDAYILGRALRDHLSNPQEFRLASAVELYQQTRLPRTKRAQAGSRATGNMYEMKGRDFEGFSFNEGLPKLAGMLVDEWKWIYAADLDSDYEQARRCMQA